MTQDREALVVGINRYPLLMDASTRKPQHLEKPAVDAEEVAQLLEKYGNFRVQRLPEEYSPEGTRGVDRNPPPQNLVTVPIVEEAIAQLFNPSGKSIPDTALLFFAGHGLRKVQGDVTEGFLATSDVNPDKGKWGVSLRWLRELLQKSPVRQQIIWLDCCHSGELLNFVAEGDPGNRGLARDRCLIAASREFEVAFEEFSGNHGVLTGALLQALNPEQHSDGWVTNYSLVDFIKQQLQTSRQRPLFHNIGSEIILTGKKEKINRAVLMAGVCPYKGLSYFDFNEEDPKYFYGRTQLTDQLLEKVREGNFLAVVGASGGGKSSVVRAGLLHQLKLGQRLGGSDEWVIKIFRPGEHPLKSLALAFAKDENYNTYLETRLTNALNSVKRGAEGLKSLVQTTARDKRLVLVVDQFEEVFTLCQDETQRQQFLDCLLKALEITDNQLCLILTMRADFFGKCAEQDYGGLASKIQENLVTVTPMNREELEQAITEPAKKVGLEIERELVSQMLEDVEGPGSLPLLQYTLTELWQQRQVERLRLAEYTRLGGVKGTLQKRADEVYQSLSEEEQRTAKRIFLELTQLGEGTEDTRRQVFKTELINAPQSAALVEEVLRKLVDARLVVMSELRARGEGDETVTVVDVAHEALIRHWSLLRQWLTENREAIRRERKIEEAAQEWERKGKPQDLAYLLQGAKLVEAETFLQDYSDLGLLSSLAQEFVQKSITRRNNRHRLNRAIVICMAGALAGIAISAWIQNVNDRLNALSASSGRLLDANKEFDALIESLRSVEQLKQPIESVVAKPDTRIRVVTALQRAVYGVRERNRLQENMGAYAVSFSPDRKTLAFAGADNTVKLWSLDGRLRSILPGHKGTVLSVSFSPDGKTLASASTDKTVKLWSLKDGKLLKTLEGHSETVRSVSFSPDGKTLASASMDKTVKLWSLDGTLLKNLLVNQGQVNSVSFSPDGQTLAMGCCDGDKDTSCNGVVKLWSIKDGKFLKPLNTEQRGVWSVSFSPKGKGQILLATGGDDGKVKLWQWDGNLFNPFKTLEKHGHRDEVWAVSFSPDGKFLASVSRDKSIKIWNLQKDDYPVKTLYGHQQGVWGVAWHPDSQILASASLDKTVKLWNRADVQRKTLQGKQGTVASVSFSPNGQLLASATRHRDKKQRKQIGNAVQLWSLDGELLNTLKGHDDWVNSVSFSPDDQLVASASWDGSVKLWRLDGTLLNTIKDKDRLWSVSFSPNGQTLASASADKTVKLWRLDGTLLNTLKGHSDKVYGVSFSPDGQTLASASEDNTVKLWRTKDGKLLRTLQKHTNGVWGVSFSPDGQKLASASADGTVKLWNKNGELLNTFQGHTGNVLSVSFSPDGQILASSSADQKVKLWSLDGTLLDTLHGNVFYSVSFSPEGQTLAASSEDGTVILWNLNLDNLQMRGCHWVREYLNNPNNGMPPDDDRRHLCDGVKISAPLLVEQGRNLAKEGDMEGAVAKFQQAQELNPSLKLNPKALAQQLAAPSLALSLVEQGRDLLKKGDMEGAAAKFQKAQELDRSLKLDPKALAQRLKALSWLDKGENLIKEGKVKEAIAAYTEVQKLDPTWKISAKSWNLLCRFGSLHGYAKEVMFACEKAVVLAPENGEIRDSRGLARTLTGDKQGAIEDFQAFSKWAEKNEKYEDKAQRQRWIAALRTGKYPFTPEEITWLLKISKR